MKRVLCVGRISAPEDDPVFGEGIRYALAVADVGVGERLYSKVFVSATTPVPEGLRAIFNSISKAAAQRGVEVAR